MKGSQSLLMLAAIGFACGAVSSDPVEPFHRPAKIPPDTGGSTRRNRTPEQSSERLTARQERMRKKAERRASREVKP